MKEVWESFIQFLADYDAPRLAQAVRELDWRALVSNPIVWLVMLPLLLVMIWRKQFRLLLAMLSFVVFVYLLQYTLPPPGETIPLHKLLKFIGGSLALGAVNVYCTLLRD